MLDDLYQYYNKELFEGKLCDCMIITSRKKGASGFFIFENWKNKKPQKGEKEKGIHEISLNPDGLDRKDEEWQSTLVHEMCHLWQYDFGKPSRTNYHNKEWAQKMEGIGLMPSNTGKEGGKKTGQGMTHYIIPDGAFIKAFNKLKEKKINYITSGAVLAQKSKSARSKTKYACECGINVWGKPGLKITCNACQKLFWKAE
jgi:predicted SprT family Zn-dependent metalloprotease